MAPPLFEIPCSVFLPGKLVLSQADIDYQWSHGGDFNCEGLNIFTITLMAVVTIAVFLRLWSRKIAKIEWKSDDYTLIAGWVLSMAAQACSLNVTYNGGLCRHTYANQSNKPRFEQFGKTAYAWNVLYTTSYPISRISLVLLYRRVFIQQWVRKVCWFLLFAYVGYAIGSMIADLCAAFPVQSNWNPDIKATRYIDGKALFLANSGFNIATDVILLILPLIVIWTLKRSRANKLGLSAIFCLGVLTVIASIARLVYYYKYVVNDPMWGLPTSQYWTIAEMDLGLLCPCLVTFGPLIRSGYLVFSSHLPLSKRKRIERITGMSSAYASETQKQSFNFDANGSSSMKINGVGFQPSLRSNPSHLEAGGNGTNGADPIAIAVTTGSGGVGPRDKDGMAVNQAIALANLDPRFNAQELQSRNNTSNEKLGSSTSAVANKPPNKAPDQGIGISRGWRLDSV